MPNKNFQIGQRWKQRDGEIVTIANFDPKDTEWQWATSNGNWVRADGTYEPNRTTSPFDLVKRMPNSFTTLPQDHERVGYPVPEGTIVEVKRKNGDKTTGTVGDVMVDLEQCYWAYTGNDRDIIAYRIVQAAPEVVEPAVDTREHTGGSTSYYKVRVETPTSGGEPYEAECNDIIEALDMTFAEGNVLKALWRIAAHRKGLSKRGYDDGVYDAEKIVFFGQRVLAVEKKKAAK